MKCLVTGSEGFIGRNLVRRLEYEGHEVRGLDKREGQGGPHWYVDITQRYTSKVVLDFEIDWIFHLAARPRIQQSFKDPTGYFATNATGTLNLLDAVVQSGLSNERLKAFVYAGSSTADAGYQLNPYACSKRIGEMLCETYRECYGVPTVVTRLYNVYGPGQSEIYSMMGIFKRQYLAGELLTVTAPGKQRRDFTHVEDICRGMILAAKLAPLVKECPVYSIGTGTNYSVNEVARMFGCGWEWIDKRLGEAKDTLCIDTTLADNAKESLNIQWTITRNLPEYIQEFKANNKPIEQKPPK